METGHKMPVAKVGPPPVATEAFCSSVGTHRSSAVGSAPLLMCPLLLMSQLFVYQHARVRLYLVGRLS
jgi:hypothetical protein